MPLNMHHAENEINHAKYAYTTTASLDRGKIDPMQIADARTAARSCAMETCNDPGLIPDAGRLSVPQSHSVRNNHPVSRGGMVSVVFGFGSILP